MRSEAGWTRTGRCGPRGGAGGVSAIAAALLACVVAALCGCASPRGHEFRPVFLEGPQSVIYVFRPGGGLSRGSVGVVVNQEPVGTLRPGEYLSHVVGPGEYYVRVEGDSSAVQRVRLLDGETAFLRVTTAGIGVLPTIERLPSEDGAERIRAMRLAEPE